VISQQDIGTIIGSNAVDTDGDKLGKVGQVYLDDQTGRPEWATVSTGLFGTSESFVPLAEAQIADGTLRLPYQKAKVKDAPRVDADGHLSPEQEKQLYRYYDVGTGTAGHDTSNGHDTTTGTAGQGLAAGTGLDRDRDRDRDLDRARDRDRDRDRDRNGVRDDLEGRTVGRDTSGPTTDDAMTRSEEQLRVGTQQVEAGRARLRKYVVTEDVTTTVPVSREEVRIEREPITDANAGAALDGPAISEEEHEVVLHAERPMVDKEAVPVERVRLDTETVTEHQQVTDTVRKEQIEADSDGITGGTDRR